ncbi:type IV pilus biogenesis protein CpaD/CtpE [Acetobacter oeni]|nr:type IV pilus biogenesis protein CpaD/CtpE [Acetobacter oeni]
MKISHLPLTRSPGKVLAALIALGLSACTGQAGTPVAPGSYPPNTPLGGTCKAGIYTCQLPLASPVGAPCSCPGLGAASYGKVYQK